MSDDQRTFLILPAVVLASAAAMPFLLGTEDAVHQQRWQAIADMTHADRVRLERNFRQFLQLSEPEREHYRRLHAALAGGRTGPHGRANAALEIYSRWLESLSPDERDALRAEQDPAKKVRLVRELLDSRRERHHTPETDPHAERQPSCFRASHQADEPVVSTNSEGYDEMGPRSRSLTWTHPP